MIRGYRADINPELSGFRTSAYVTLNLRQGHWRQIAERFQSLPDIVHIAVVGGEFEAVLSRFVPAIKPTCAASSWRRSPGSRECSTRAHCSSSTSLRPLQRCRSRPEARLLGCPIGDSGRIRDGRQ